MERACASYRSVDFERIGENSLAAEVEERQQRRIAWRLSEAKLPKVKTLEDFDFNVSSVSTTQVRGLADGSYLERAELVILLGDTGTGKTHRTTALCVETCRQNKRVRFTTVAALINELVEASHNSQLGRAMARWKKWDLIALDEMGYVPLADVGTEMLFQIIADRAEKARHHHHQPALLGVVVGLPQHTHNQSLLLLEIDNEQSPKTTKTQPILSSEPSLPRGAIEDCFVHLRRFFSP